MLFTLSGRHNQRKTHTLQTGVILYAQGGYERLKITALNRL